MAVNNLNILGDLLTQKYTDVFFQQMQSSSIFNFDRQEIPSELLCTACFGTGETGSNNRRMCRICQGKRIAPIPACEVLETKRSKKPKKFADHMVVQKPKNV